MSSELEKYLRSLMENNTGISMSGLERLSGLFPEQLRQFKRAWPQISLERRRRIVRSLAELTEDNVEFDFNSVFRACLEDPDEEVRAEAIAGLWEDDSAETGLVLVKKLQSDSSAKVRAAAAAALGTFTYLAEMGKLNPRVSKTIRDALVSAIYDETEAIEVRRRAVEGISYLNEEPVSSLIQWAYRHPDPKMRASAVFAMGRNCDMKWLPVIQDEMSSSSAEMRYEAARACGELESKECAPQLVALTRDADREVQIAAIISLGQVGGKLAKQALQKILEGGDETLQEIAEQSLEEVKFREDPLGFTQPF
ncbi:MAG: HEAT repeat domain-containing protein [Chloroflexi bacterium]|nr:HEAT repeat domain-containing protein [Chloroflexota bacterium]